MFRCEPTTSRVSAGLRLASTSEGGSPIALTITAVVSGRRPQPAVSSAAATRMVLTA